MTGSCIIFSRRSHDGLALLKEGYRHLGLEGASACCAPADAEGCPTVWWLTQEFNGRGRMLYDQVGVQTPFIRYNWRG